MNSELAIITGGGTGIGQAITYNLVEKGYHVLITGRREQPLKDTANKNPEKITWVSADVSKEEGREKIVAAIPESTQLKYLVHNAGIITPLSAIKNLKLDEFRKIQAINVEGPLFLTQALIPKFNGGRILHISSGAAHHAYHSWGCYCITKAALYMLYLCCNSELQEYGILTGSVRPGIVDTDMQTVLRDDKNSFPNQDHFKQMKDDNQLVTVDECATFICQFLTATTDAQFAQKEVDIRD